MTVALAFNKERVTCAHGTHNRSAGWLPGRGLADVFRSRGEALWSSGGGLREAFGEGRLLNLAGFYGTNKEFACVKSESDAETCSEAGRGEKARLTGPAVDGDKKPRHRGDQTLRPSA